MQSLGYLPISQSSLSVSRCAFLSGIRLLTLIAGILAAVGSPLVATADPELRAESPEVMKAGGYCPPAPNECSPSVCNVKCFSCEELLGAAEQCKPPPPPAKGQWVSTVGACNALCGAGGVQPIAHHCELSGARVDDSKCDASERPTKDEEGCIGAPCDCKKANSQHVDSEANTSLGSAPRSRTASAKNMRAQERHLRRNALKASPQIGVVHGLHKTAAALAEPFLTLPWLTMSLMIKRLGIASPSVNVTNTRCCL